MNIKKHTIKMIGLVSILATLFYSESQAQINKPFKDNEKIYINLYYKEAELNDTLTLVCHKAMRPNVISSISAYKNYKAIINKAGYFRFEVPVDENFGYFVISKPRTFSSFQKNDWMNLIDKQLWERGDSISIHLSHPETMLAGSWTGEFSGRGALKYSIAKEISDYKAGVLKMSTRINGISVDFKPNMLLSDNFELLSERDVAKLDLLNKYKRSLTPFIYEVIKANIIYGNLAYSGYLKNSAKYYTDSLRDEKIAIKKRYLDRYNLVFGKNYRISDEALANSWAYMEYLYAKYKVNSYLNVGSVSMDWIYNSIKKDTYGILRENLILKCFLELQNSEGIETLYTDARTVIQSPIYLNLLNDIAFHSPGRKFPDFKVEDMNGNKVSLSELKSKVVLIDFWFTNCGGCAKFYETTLSKVEDEFRGNSNVLFLSVTIDSDKGKWLKSIQSGLYTSTTTNVTNVYTNGEGANHEIIKKNNIQWYPTAILIDKEGKIKYFNSTHLYKEDTLTLAINELLQ